MARNEPREQGDGIPLALQRAQSGKSLEQLAADTGIAAGHLSRIERGLRPMSKKTAKLLAKHFGIRASYFMGTD